jgi:hypothetical protein
MKTKLAILGSLAILSAGIWYLFFRDQAFERESEKDPVGPIQEEHPHEHIRQIMHKSKELAS